MMATQKVLVTGAAGFIGSHLAEACVERGYRVTAFVHYNSANSWGWLEGSPLKSEMEIVAGDVRDYDSVSAALHGADTVFHLAALIGIPYSYASPLAYVRTNVEGTYNILQAARMLETANVVVTSTSEVYGTAQSVPISETHPLSAQSPYAATKIGADQLALSYARSYGLPVKIARPFNTYGPRQSARAVIPTVITQILSGAERVQLGNLQPTRDLTFVADTAAGFLAIAAGASLNGEVTHIGMSAEISVGDLARLIAQLLEADVEVEEDDRRVRPPASEVERLVCDNRKILERTSWRPEFDLASGLARTIDWLRSNLDRYKPHLYNV